MEDSSSLIKRCNEYLTELQQFREYLLELRANKTNIDKSTYDEITNKLKENLEILEDLKEKMEICGFDTPYMGVGTLKGCDDSDIYEIKNYSSHLRRMVDEKKGALERVRYAIISHKMAIGNLSDDAGNKNIIFFLPYGGAYKELLMQLPSIFIKSYKKILNIFELNHKGVLSSITMSIVVIENGKRKFKRIKIEDEDYDAYIEKRYGDALITSLKKNYSKNKLITDSYVKKTIVLAYLLTYADDIEKEINKRLNNTLSKHQRDMIVKYLEITANYDCEYIDGGVIDFRRMDEIRLKKQELNEELEKYGLFKDGKIIDELQNALNIEKNIYDEVCYEIPMKYLSNDLFKYYLYNTPDERSRSNMFPSILLTPAMSQLTWTNMGDNINPKSVLDLKFLLERELPNYKISLKNVGGIALYLIHDWDAVKKYGYNKKDIESILKDIAPLSDLMSNLKEKNIDIEKIEKYNTIKKKRTKKFLNVLSKL
ncbi:DUF530 domain-containing protein [Methanococcus aeolicus]|uniref:DUF530 domain-containing protein n=1 Tax=Methanococcus aeolicus TaxID=42879 RepID=UPI0021C78B97|nr:DUF530 domain-containing protein [Methanococcus aeolicus]UXM84298.1 DUF530 domain-containing protein [Methanococcus aeolicus]